MTERLDMKTALAALRHGWRLMVLTALITVTITGAVTFTQTPQYAATAQLFVSTPSGDGAEAYQGGLFSQQRVTSYASLVVGDEVASRVRASLGLQARADDISAQLSSSIAPATVLLEVTATDADPQRAKKLANAAATEFSSYVTELESVPGDSVPPIKVTVTDRADLPSEPVSPQPVRNLGLALIIGLLVGAGLALLRETLDTSIKSGDDVTNALPSSLLGVIRYDSEASKRPLITDLDSHAPRVEAFRVLRTNLQFIDIDSPSKTLAVTSSLPGEGKSSTATNLAITLAEAGQRVILVEADLRRPKLGEYLRLEPAVGLTSVLIGRVRLCDALQEWGKVRLPVLMSGPIPPNPAELLQSQAMSEVFAELRKSYDVVIIDAPPLLPVTDAALLTMQADGAIVVVRHGVISREQLKEAGQRIGAVGGRILGAVLNMAPDRGPGGYGYGYGYAPEPGKRTADRVSA